MDADEARARLVERVRELAYLHSPDDPFTLASGRISPHFFDMKPVIKGRGGRKTGNPPGIEGSSLSEGDRVVLLEDVTTTGGSALKAAARLTEMGCEVAACITILDREEGGAEAFVEAGVDLRPLIVRSDVTGE